MSAHSGNETLLMAGSRPRGVTSRSRPSPQQSVTTPTTVRSSSLRTHRPSVIAILAVFLAAAFALSVLIAGEVSLLASVMALAAVCLATGIWGASSRPLLEPITGLSALIFLEFGVGAPILLAAGQFVVALPAAVMVAALGWACFAVGYRMNWGVGLTCWFPVPVAQGRDLGSYLCGRATTGRCRRPD